MQWLTGWQYQTFVAYHRHTARVMFYLVVIHAVLFTVALADYYSTDVKETYLIWGIIATIAGGIILVQAMLFQKTLVRNLLFIHIVLAALWVAGAWIHVEELGYIWFVYPTVAVWCFDRAVRIGRLIVFGFPKAQVTLMANETLKVVIPKPRHWKSVPGGHAFYSFHQTNMLLAKSSFHFC